MTSVIWQAAIFCKKCFGQNLIGHLISLSSIFNQSWGVLKKRLNLTFQYNSQIHTIVIDVMIIIWSHWSSCETFVEGKEKEKADENTDDQGGGWSVQRDGDEGVPGDGGWHAGQHDFELRNGDGDEDL